MRLLEDRAHYLGTDPAFWIFYRARGRFFRIRTLKHPARLIILPKAIVLFILVSLHGKVAVNCATFKAKLGRHLSVLLPSVYDPDRRGVDLCILNDVSAVEPTKEEA